MYDANMIDVNFTDLDYAMGFGSFYTELATARGSIEERIGQLYVVAARQRQRRSSCHRQNPMEIGHYFSDEREILDGIHNMGIAEEISQKESFFIKGDSSHLVATALEMDSVVKKDDDNYKNGSYYDCNVCFYVAKEPVLTCCGHLFCWACFYQVSDIDSMSKECPVCRGEVSFNTTVPIYGNGGSSLASMAKSGLIIPARHKAMRTERRTKEQDVKENDASVSSDLRFAGWVVEDLQSSIYDQCSIYDANNFSFNSNQDVDDESNAMLVSDGSGSDVNVSSCLLRRKSPMSTQDTRETSRRRLN